MFRKEAVTGVATPLHGRILLPGALGHQVLTVFYFSVAVGICLLLAFATVSKKAVLQGSVIPTGGIVRIIAPGNGVITGNDLPPGHMAKRGDKLFTIVAEQPTLDDQSTSANVGRLLAERQSSLQIDRQRLRKLAQEKLHGLGQRISELKVEETQAGEQLSLQGTRVELAAESLKRTQSLVASSFLSPAQAETQLAQLIDQKQRFAELQRTRAQLARDRNSYENEAAQLQLQTLRDDQSIERTMSSLQQEVEENRGRRGLSITSPIDGQVAAVTATPGQHVIAGTVLGALVPADAKLEVDLYAPSRAVGFLRAGLPVLIRYESFPHQKFGQYAGTVVDVTRTALRPEDYQPIALSTTTAPEGMYRVRVALQSQSIRAYGKLIPLQAGMALEATVILEKRKLFEWILDPILSMTGRL